MNRVKQMGGIVLAFLSVVATGCGGSASSPVGTVGNITGTVTRVIVPGISDEGSVRIPSSDTDVEIYQGNVLRETSRTDAQGRFTISVPVGRYRVKPSDAILERTPAVIGSQDVTVSAGKTVPVELEITIPSI